MENLKIEQIATSRLHLNHGQLAGVPKNPRKISKDAVETLKKSLTDDPEMLHLRELLVVPFEDGYVVIAGNSRLKAARELKFQTMPCKVLPSDTDPKKLRAYAAKDNVQSGEWDIDALATEWDADELTDWGVAIPPLEEPSDDSDYNEERVDGDEEDDEESLNGERLGVPYMGSKSRIAKLIIDKLPLADTFVDLFAGGCAVTHAAMISGKYKHFIANDLLFGPQLFADAIAGKYANETRVPDREEFFRLQATDPYIALCYSFGNDMRIYLWGRDIEPFKVAMSRALLSPTLEERYAYWRDAYRALETYAGNAKRLQRLERLQGLQGLQRLQRLERLQGLEQPTISRLDYREVAIPENAVIYCDIPYKGTAVYDKENDFDHDAFYEWVRAQERPVFISEYAMPSDFVCIWKKSVMRSLCAASRTKENNINECLFVHERFADQFKND